jgi:hypothetical protein
MHPHKRATYFKSMDNSFDLWDQWDCKFALVPYVTLLLSWLGSSASLCCTSKAQSRSPLLDGFFCICMHIRSLSIFKDLNVAMINLLGNRLSFLKHLDFQQLTYFDTVIKIGGFYHLLSFTSIRYQILYVGHNFNLICCTFKMWCKTLFNPPTMITTKHTIDFFSRSLVTSVKWL